MQAEVLVAVMHEMRCSMRYMHFIGLQAECWIDRLDCLSTCVAQWQGAAKEWGPLDDVVMGGRSESGFTIEPNVGIFSGIVTEGRLLIPLKSRQSAKMPLQRLWCLFRPQAIRDSASQGRPPHCVIREADVLKPAF